MPRNMGWLWNTNIVGLPIFRHGWKPGAIRKSVAKIMKLYFTPPAEPAPNAEQEQAPTLRVQKKNGEFTIVMNPLRDEAETLENPSPIVFKISKSDEVKKRSCARKLLKSRGMEKKCNCTTIDSCCCLSKCEKAQLKYEMEQVSKELCLKPEMSVNDLKASSESEIDIEFTPPWAAKLKHPSMKCQPIKVSVAETQYEPQLEDLSWQKSSKGTLKKMDGKAKLKETVRPASTNKIR